MPHRRRLAADDVGEQPIIGAILRPQLALILGALALVASRAIAMNYLMTEPSIHLLGWGEGLVVLLLLFVIGLLFGKWDPVSHGALVVGAAVAFHAETYYIPFVPELMKSIYNPHYVSLVLLNAQ